MRFRFHTAVVGLGGSLTALVLAGCGSAAPTTGLPAAVAAELHRDLTNVRMAADAHRPGRARLALEAFAAAVSAQRAGGALTARETSALRAGIAQARERIAAEVHNAGGSVPKLTPIPAPAPTPGALQPPLASANGDGNGNGNGNGNGKDHAKGQGKDQGGGGGGD